MKYQTRANWNAKPPKWKETIKTSKGMFIHYNGPAVNNAVLQGDYESVKRFLQGIQNFHMNTRGWPDIAYSWCVDSVGRIWELRGWAVAGAHTLNHNWDSHAIFLPLGGNQTPTKEQIASCKIVIAEHNRRFGAGFVKGHQDAPNSTSCPGPVVLPMVRRGDFNPTPQQQQIVEGDTTMKPVMMRQPNGAIWIYYSNPETVMHEHPNGDIWLMYPNTPYRQKVRPADVNTFKYFGIKTQKIDQNFANFLWRNTVEGKPPRIHVKTPADAQTFQFLGVKQIQIDAKQTEFFNHYHQAR
jgi:hypothetical protein